MQNPRRLLQKNHLELYEKHLGRLIDHKLRNQSWIRPSHAEIPSLPRVINCQRSRYVLSNSGQRYIPDRLISSSRKEMGLLLKSRTHRSPRESHDI
jgi:hypothetical protein